METKKNSRQCSVEQFGRNTETDVKTDTQPACSASGPGTQHWRETPYSEVLSEFFDPCTDCFPNGSVTTANVVRSRRCPNRLHRPRDSECSNGAAIPEPDGGEVDQFEDSDPVPIDLITEFQSGDGVIWSDVSSPLIVEQTTTDPGGTLALTGPTGSTYSLQCRPEMVVSYAIYPSYGLVDDIYRLPAASSEADVIDYFSS